MAEQEREVAIITGGTRGIGAAIARDLAKRNVDLVLSGRFRDAEVDALVAELSPHVNVLFEASDASDPASGQALVDATMKRFGRIDYLIPAAGGAVPGKSTEVAPEAWENAFRVHVHGPFYLFRAAHAALAVRGGSVLLVSSVAGVRGVPNAVAYATVKGSLLQLGRALARDHAHENIRVNIICPGVILTRFHAAMTPEARKNNLENRIPLRRFGTAENVSSASLELLFNPYITGETLVIDGGLSMRVV